VRQRPDADAIASATEEEGKKKAAAAAANRHTGRSTAEAKLLAAAFHECSVREKLERWKTTGKAGGEREREREREREKEKEREGCKRSVHLLI
jgi:hypothetical protein